MKLFQSLLCPTFESLSGLAVRLSNVSIPGHKTRSKLLMEAMASTEGMPIESLKSKLDAIHQKAYCITRKEISMPVDTGWEGEMRVRVDLAVAGYYGDAVVRIDFTSYSDYQEAIPSVFAGKGDGCFTASEAALNLQLAIGFAANLISELKAYVAKGELKSFISKDWVISSVGKSTKYLPCPECDNKDNDPGHVGFTYPSNEHGEFVVCQCCGRRTKEEEWNNPKADVIESL